MADLTVLEIVTFAEKFNIPVGAAHTLPAIFDKIASISKRPVRVIINAATYDDNPELGNFVKEQALELAKVVPSI